MKYFHIIAVILLLATSASAMAGQAEYDDCILEHLKNAKLDVVTHIIKQACEENYMKKTFTSDKRRAYNKCLLEHLEGVESFQAVMDIRAACGNRYK